jgi:hypothetical protein
MGQRGTVRATMMRRPTWTEEYEVALYCKQGDGRIAVAGPRALRRYPDTPESRATHAPTLARYSLHAIL